MKRVIRSDDFLSDEDKEILRRADTSDWSQMQTERQQDEIDRAGGYDRYLRKEHDRRSVESTEDFVVDYDLKYLDEDPRAWEREERRRKQREIDDENAEYDRTHEITSAINPFKTKYQVHWVSPDGKDCLLGGSNNIEEANDIACEQAQEIFESPFETDERKFHFLQELYIVELPSEQDAMLTDTEDYIDNLMSEIDSRM